MYGPFLYFLCFCFRFLLQRGSTEIGFICATLISKKTPWSYKITSWWTNTLHVRNNKCMDHFCIFYVFVFGFYYNAGAQKSASFVRHWFQKRLLDPTRLPHGELIRYMFVIINVWTISVFFLFLFSFLLQPGSTETEDARSLHKVLASY